MEATEKSRYCSLDGFLLRDYPRTRLFVCVILLPTHLLSRSLPTPQALDSFVNLRSLWLEHNAIEEISGLDALVNLRCLFLMNNNITRISGLEKLKNLVQLQLSHNNITSIEGLSECKSLNNLDLQGNKITDISGVLECPTISILNLSHNKISEESVPDTFAKLPEVMLVFLVFPASSYNIVFHSFGQNF